MQNLIGEQFPPQHRMPTLVQRPAALRADPFLLRQFMNDLLRRQAGKVRFPFALAFFPLVCNLFQIRLCRVWQRNGLRLVKQRKVLRFQSSQHFSSLNGIIDLLNK